MIASPEFCFVKTRSKNNNVKIIDEMNLPITDLVPSHVQILATTAILHLKSLITFSLDFDSSLLISLFLL